MIKVVETVLASALAAGGTFTVNYPTGTTRGDFLKGVNHQLLANQTLFQCPTDITLSFGASNITVTYNGSTPIDANTRVVLQLDAAGGGKLHGYEDLSPGIVSEMKTVLISLGSPAAIDDNGICESQNRTGAGALLINGALSDGDLATSVATLDVPRNVIADSGGADTAVITVTGTDVYGNVMSENITLNGTTAVPGKKAFKTITSVTSDGTISNGFFLGTGDVLGLPVYLPNTAQIIKQLENNAAATDGTAVAGLAVTTKSTATTADVRGTYDPNSACDGSKGFALLVALEEPTFKGNPQYAG